MKRFLRLFLRLVLVMLFLAMPGTASAQMVETFKDDQSSQTASSVMEVYFCESEDGFSFSLYDMRVNPEKRVLHKYEIKGLEAETGNLKRARKDRKACAGAPESSLTSEPVKVDPIPVPDEDDHLWVLQLKLEGNLTLPIAVVRNGLPFRILIQYHPETKEFTVQP